MALWCPGPGYQMISTGVAGGGIGPREWVLNAQVPAGYVRMDPAVHVAELGADLGLAGEGVGLLSAARVTDAVQCEDEEVRAAATVGLRVPAWAAVPPGSADRELDITGCLGPWRCSRWAKCGTKVSAARVDACRPGGRSPRC